MTADQGLWVIEPIDVRTYALAHGWVQVAENDRAYILQKPGAYWLKRPEQIHLAKQLGSELFLSSAIEQLARDTSVPFYQLCASLGYTKASNLAAKQRNRLVQTLLALRTRVEQLTSVLVSGLGLANELGEGDRWAAWRLRAHLTVKEEQPDHRLIALILAARDWRKAVEQTDGVHAAEQKLIDVLRSLEDSY